MFEYYEYPDKDLVADVLQGFPLTGWLPDSQVFPKDFKPPSMDVHTLQSLSLGINERVRAKVLATDTSELLEATWEETEKELKEGWMEVDPGEGRDSSWAMRFGLQQRDKVRVIDDFSIAGVNNTAGLQERLKNIWNRRHCCFNCIFLGQFFRVKFTRHSLEKTMDLKKRL